MDVRRLPTVPKYRSRGTQKDRKRESVLGDLDAHRSTAVEAAQSLGVTERHVWRLLAAFRQEGADAVVHGNRGRMPIHTVPLEVHQRIIELAQTKYVGFNQAHFAEKLRSDEKIMVSRPTVWRILKEAGIRSPQRHRRPKHRSRRERRPRAGMMLQVDGSDHDWLEGRGPRLTLLGAVDDATGEVVAALFRAEEDTHGYMLLLYRIVLQRGIPLAIYADQHSIFIHTPGEKDTIEEQLAGQRAPTQLGRILDELAIEMITALSPQAKGRVERLWGTFQDRLVSELRLAGICTREHANQFLECYLPTYNAQFARSPAETDSAYRPVPAKLDLNVIFAFQYSRIVANDNTVRVGATTMQIPANTERSSYAKAKTLFCVGIDGSTFVLHNGRRIAYMPSKNPKADIRAEKR
jgi:transposase